MNPRPAPLALWLAALAAWAMFLAEAVDRPELAFVAVPSIAVLLAGTRGFRALDLRVTQRLSQARINEGDRATVSIAIEARSPLPLVEIVGATPSNLLPIAGDNRVVLALDAGEIEEGELVVEALSRGRARLGQLSIRAWDAAGLWVSETQHDTGCDLLVYPKISPIRHLPRPWRTRSSFGNHASRRLGQGLEPGGVRQFAPGDRLRQINWRASLRFGRLYVTEYHEERNADVILLLDTTADIGRRPDSSLDVSVRAVATLTQAYLDHRDRVGLIKYGGNVHWIRPGSGRRQREALMDALMSTDTFSNYHFGDLDFLPPRVLPPGALVIAVSPMTDHRFVRVVANLAMRGFDVVVLAVSLLDIMRPLAANTRSARLAGRLWQLERQRRLAELSSRGLAIVEMPADRPLEGVLGAMAYGGPRRSLRR